jgi:nitrate reductase NapE component
MNQDPDNNGSGWSNGTLALFLVLFVVLWFSVAVVTAYLH